MIFHNCIKCDAFETIPIADKTPAFQKYICPECGQLQWIRHSRFQSVTYHPDDVDVNEKTKHVSIKEVEDN